MIAETVKATAEAEIRALMDKYLHAIHARDVDRIVACYAPDILAFDAISQLQFKGVEAYRTHWEACLAMCPGPMIFEMHDLSVAASDDVAFSHWLTRCGGTSENGEEKTSWMRATGCYRKRNGKWALAHEHYSAPFDVATGKALLELTP